uniref:CA domain-containing protein n=1 Tax=Macrostomum lignano TaxID=282301 RepID=A0A1I8JCM9_9PLAT
ANRRIVYSLPAESGPLSDRFRVDPQTGLVTLGHSRLDRELSEVHRIPVVARDSGQPPRSSTHAVLLTVMDVNDNPPVFEPSSLDFSLSEDTPVNYRIAQLRATSRDAGLNGAVRYRLMDNDALFSVDAVHGTLSLKSRLDYERQSLYYLTVTAFDLSASPLVSTAVVTVRVLDENDNSPVFPAEGFNVTVKENTKAGSPLSLAVVATDADSGENSRLAYRIESGDPDGLFNISEATGQLFVRVPPDRETRDRLTLTVSARDHGRPQRSASTAVRVLVLDENDCRPQFDRREYTFVLPLDESGNATQQPYLVSSELIYEH